MLAIVWTNPEAPQCKPKATQRMMVDDRELILVDGTEVWTVFTSASTSSSGAEPKNEGSAPHARSAGAAHP